jgi:3-phenylpropionate/cinnamic acid dioxygenase small subunit
MTGAGMLRGTDLQHELEGLYYREADLLDDRAFDEWLELLDEELVYWMPLVRNVSSHESGELSRQGVDMAWFDEGKETLRKRVAQLKTGMHWSEEPVSRVTRIITNIRITEEDRVRDEVTARSKFLLYQNRQEDEVNVFAGKRRDRWRRRDTGGWSLIRREILLDQNVLLAKSLSVFF